jgi:hypothetical protein
MKYDQKGLIALISILVISSVVLIITISLSWHSIAELQMSWWTNESQVAYQLSESCMEEGLNALRLSWENHNINLSIGDDSCIIDIVTTINTATVTSVASVDDITRSIVATLDTSLEFISWQEN